MKLNKILTAVLATATMILTGATTLNASENIQTKSNKSMLLAYYGQVNSNGTVRTKRVNGYRKSNGTYVNSYYRS